MPAPGATTDRPDGTRRVLQRTDSRGTRDAVGTVSTHALPATIGGAWSYGRSLPTDFHGIHAVVMPGKILVIAGSGNDRTQFEAGTFRSLICDSRLQNCKTVYLWAFNPRTNTYQQLRPMDVGGWYPSLVTVSGGQTLITGGIDQNGAFTASAELFQYKNNTHRLITRYALGVKLPPARQ